MKQGANLNKTDCHFGTPLHTAVSKGCVESAKVLLKAGELNKEQNAWNFLYVFIKDAIFEITVKIN